MWHIIQQLGFLHIFLSWELVDVWKIKTFVIVITLYGYVECSIIWCKAPSHPLDHATQHFISWSPFKYLSHLRQACSLSCDLPQNYPDSPFPWLHSTEPWNIYSVVLHSLKKDFNCDILYLQPNFKFLSFGVWWSIYGRKSHSNYHRVSTHIFMQRTSTWGLKIGPSDGWSLKSLSCGFKRSWAASCCCGNHASC